MSNQKRINRTTLILSLLLALTLALAACGTSGPAAAPADTGSDTAPAEEAAAPDTESNEAEADAPAEEASAVDGVVVIGTNAEYQPFEYVDANGEIVGYDIDLMNALAEAAALEVEFVNTKWDGIFVALSNGEFDAVISAVTITPERDEVVDFTEAYFNAGQALAVREDNDTITGPDDLTEGVNVGVQLGTTGDIYVSDNTEATVQRYEETPLAIQSLANGDVDAVVADGPTLADYLRANPELGLKIVGEPFTDELYGIAVNEDRQDVLEALNSALQTIRSNGTYDQIYNEWFGTEKE